MFENCSVCFLKNKQKVNATKLNYDTPHTALDPYYISEFSLNVISVHFQKLSPRDLVYYIEKDRELLHNIVDFCFVNKRQRGEKLSSAQCGSHQTAPNMDRKARSRAAA
jgi:hypothetical protein